ncbi:MAG: hypothetical protein AAB425_13840, partial [Bdellovibrionota bacterium]
VWAVLLAMIGIGNGSTNPAICEQRAFHLTDTAEHPYFGIDGDLSPSIPTIVAWAKRHGATELILNPVATIHDPAKSDVLPALRTRTVEAEKSAYVKLIGYIRAQGLTVSLRPIVLVVNPIDHSALDIWHGVIEPADPETWYANYLKYHQIYWSIAAEAPVASYVLGAELASMTVGNPLGSSGYRRGFLARYLKLARLARAALPANTLLEYDVNYTDDFVPVGEGWMPVGEFGTWVDVAVNGKRKDRKNLRKILKILDRIGVDNYRSLIAADAVVPVESTALKSALAEGARRIRLDLSYLAGRLQEAAGVVRLVAIRETGFKSVTRGFVDPFLVASGELNLQHQAMAMDVSLAEFCQSSEGLASAMAVWDLSTNPHLHGPGDRGFSPIGKSPVEAVLRNHFVSSGRTLGAVPR